MERAGGEKRIEHITAGREEERVKGSLQASRDGRNNRREKISDVFLCPSHSPDNDAERAQRP